jgi:hypothetical protein
MEQCNRPDWNFWVTNRGLAASYYLWKYGIRRNMKGWNSRLGTEQLWERDKQGTVKHNSAMDLIPDPLVGGREQTTGPAAGKAIKRLK